MDIFADLFMGLSVAVTPINLLYLLVGAMVGMIVGVIPGFGPSAGLAILLPVTFGMDPIGAAWGFRDAAELTEAGADRLVDHPLDVIGILDGGAE